LQAGADSPNDDPYSLDGTHVEQRGFPRREETPNNPERRRERDEPEQALQQTAQEVAHMPTYEYCCRTCSNTATEYRSVEHRNLGPICSCGDQMDKVISAPSMIMPDIQTYRVPGTQKYITSRSQHREHLRSNGLIEVGNEGRPPDD
jgi:predicted nucleic acid-binding Zn ribbon protein